MCSDALFGVLWGAVAVEASHCQGTDAEGRVGEPSGAICWFCLGELLDGRHPHPFCLSLKRTMGQSSTPSMP